MGSFMKMLFANVLMGVGMAAGQAVVETGQQLTAQALQQQLTKWGVDIDPNSTLGMFLDNFKSNMGFQVSYNMMKVTDGLFQSHLDKLQEKSRANEVLISNKIRQKYSTVSGKLSLVKKEIFRNPLGLISPSSSSSLDKSYKSIKLDELNSSLNAERNNCVNRFDSFLRTRSSVGTTFNGLAVGAGTNNTALNQHFTDDTKLFDSVMMLMNMKKVG